MFSHLTSRLFTRRFGQSKEKSVETATDPSILLTLWLYATIEGVSSARHLERLTQRDWVYQWICGGVSVNYHLLSDFRTAHGEFLEDLLTDSIASLIHQEIVTLETVAQDGMRVRANAGKSSFRRKKSLENCRTEAEAHLEKLRAERESDHAGQSMSRKEAAQERAAREKVERVKAALKDLETLRKQKEKRKKGSGKEARCSTTDPEARVMKMGDGGIRPAYNVQFVSDGKSQIIVGLTVTNSGSDRGQMSPMHQSLIDQYSRVPKHYLVDGGFPTIADVTQVEQAGSEVIGPIPRAGELIEKGKDPHARGPQDTDAMATFRKRMKTEEAKTRLKLRPSIAEFPNAVCRNNGLYQFPVRGLSKVTVIATWHALAFNLMRMFNLGIT